MPHESFDKNYIRKNRTPLEAFPIAFSPSSFIQQTFYRKGERCVTPGCGTILRETNPATICSRCVTNGAAKLRVLYVDYKDKSFAKLVRQLGGRLRKQLRNQKVG